MPHSYWVFEQNQAFLKEGEQYFRTNEIWRKQIDKRTGNTVGKEMILKNFGKAIYVPEKFMIC